MARVSVAEQVAQAERLSDAELFELHRAVSRLAALARLRDPEFVKRQEVGLTAAAVKRRRAGGR